MNDKHNRIAQPLFLITFAIVFLIILSTLNLPKGYFNNLNKVDVFASVRASKTNDSVLNSKINPLKSTGTSSHKFNSIPLKEVTLINDFENDSINQLSLFFNKLDSAKYAGKKVRIAYFGDSFIEGDEITDELRLQLQHSFGGSGIGFVPMQSAVSNLYTQIKIDGSGWKDYNFRDNPNNFPLGLSGHLFYPKDDAETEYSSKLASPFSTIKLYTGFNNNGISSISISKDGVNSTQNILSNELINETILNKDSSVKSLKISSTIKSLPFYGISFEANNGVYIDNYSFRGNTGLLTLQINEQTMQALNKYLNYNLIIVHYGINAVEHDKQRVLWFENGMNKLLNNLRKGFGNTPILLVSTSDRGYNYDGNYSTEKAIPYMVNNQMEIAKSNKTAFWNLYQAMGGENTMVKWVEGDTVFASKDYTHVNNKGAKRIGDLFFDKLIASKKYYQHN